ncbi:MAG TPA: prephenate dehydratase [Clostridiales bacterium]|nr:prephenate dehydratase [Clostridiales bacterium]
MIDLIESRNKIDEVDQRIVELFEERMKLAVDIAAYKKSVGKPIFDAEREKEKLAALMALTENEFNQKAVADLFRQIMSLSRRLQYSLLDNMEGLGLAETPELAVHHNTKVAFFGEKGSYTEQAMMEYFKSEVNGLAMSTFKEVMQAIKEGRADYGVLPIENSSTGTLSDIYDLLAEYDNFIIGEHMVKIDHNLWGLPGAKLCNIKRIYSHKQGLQQCAGFLQKYPNIKQIEGGSTSGSARLILEENDLTKAAIASRRAGEVFGLQLLQASIQDEDNNTTRFIIISNKKIYKKGSNRTSICFELPHQSGSLYHMLSHFIYNNISMTKIESRPIVGKAFAYRFFVDIEGGPDSPAVKNALHCMKEEALEMKILGCYVPVR